MFEFLGNALSAVTSWFGGEANRNAQQQANQENWAHQLYLDQNHIQNVVGDAKAAGINPLAALGVNTPSAPVSVGAANDQIGNVGQALGRAASALAPQDTKMKELQARLLETQIESAQQDIVSKQLQNSNNAVQRGQPGTPPGLPSTRSMNVVPLPRSRPAAQVLEYDPPTPLYQTFIDDRGDRIRLLGKEASQSLMNSASMPISLPIGAQLLGNNVFDLTAQHIRPDVLRDMLPKFDFSGPPVHRRTGRYRGGFWEGR